jgi:hypothetical protein
MTASENLEEITREEHDKIYDESLALACEQLQTVILYYQKLCADRKKYNIKYVYDAENNIIDYKVIGEKHIGFKHGQKHD